MDTVPIQRPVAEEGRTVVATRPTRTWEVTSVAALAIVFVTSRGLCRLAGVRYDAGGIAGQRTFWQIADPQLLRSDLLRTTFYLHTQPPLFNLTVGAVL